MIKRILPIAMLSAAILGNTSCKHEAEVKKVKGIEYKILKDVPGPNAKVGDMIEFHILAKCDTLTLGDSRRDNNGKPVPMQVQETTDVAQFQSVFPFLSAGDSAVVTISCDTMLAVIKKTNPNQSQLPPWLKAGNKVTVTISMVSVKSKEQAEADAKAASSKQAAEEDKALQDYFTKNNLKPTKTASGLYYIISKEGTGANIAAGQMVSMNYTGKLLNGTTFDSNLDSAFKHKELFKFPVGAHQVIPGWDEGVMLLKKGSKATLFVVSPLAYGDRAMGPLLPANSTLMFDVEVVDVAAAAAPSPAGQPTPVPAPQH